MTQQKEKIEIVTRGVTAFAAIEVALESVVLNLIELRGVYADGAKASMLTPTKALDEIGHITELIGDVGKIQRPVLRLHERGTAIAKANDADVALPSEGYAVMPLGLGR